MHACKNPNSEKWVHIKPKITYYPWAYVVYTDEFSCFPIL